MTRIIAIANQKGGVGKTTSAINISAALATSGKSVLLIDLDPQANATSGVSVEPNGATIYECIIEGQLIRSAILPTCIHGLLIIPSNGDLVGAEIELSNLADRESILKTIVIGNSTTSPHTSKPWGRESTLLRTQPSRSTPRWRSSASSCRRTSSCRQGTSPN